MLVLTVQCFETALEVLVEKRITGMPVVDDVGNLVSEPLANLEFTLLLLTLPCLTVFGLDVKFYRRELMEMNA